MVMSKNLHQNDEQLLTEGMLPELAALADTLSLPLTSRTGETADWEEKDALEFEDCETRMLQAILDDILDEVVEEVIEEVDRIEHLFDFELN